MASESLRGKTIKGVGWSAIDNIAQHVVSFVVSIVLARILSPDDYGLIGIIAIFTAVSNALINGGFTSALIRKKKVTDDDYSTSFIVNLGISLGIYCIIFLTSPLIAAFFHRSELVDLTRVSSISLIIGALGLVQQTRLTKSLDFKTQTKVTLIASLASGMIGVVMALIGFGVWALIAQSLSFNLLRTFFLFMYSHWRPKLRFSVASFRDLFGFGWKMMVVSMIDTVWKELYQLVVGKFYSPTMLGQYTRSKQFSQLFSSNLTSVIQRVTYPVLSSIQEDKEHMVSTYRHIIKMSMFVTFMSMFFVGAVAEPLLYCLIGPKWHDAAVFLPLICINGALYPLHAINLNMLQVQGRSDLFLGLEIIKKALALIPLAMGIYIGIMPMLYTNIVAGALAYFLNSYYSGKFLNYTSWMQLKDIAPSFFIAIFVAFFVFFVKYLPISYWIILPVQLILGFFIGLVSCRIAKLEEYRELSAILGSYWVKFRNRGNAANV